MQAGRGGGEQENRAPLPISAIRELAYDKAERMRAERMRLLNIEHSKQVQQRRLEGWGAGAVLQSPSFVLPRTYAVPLSAAPPMPGAQARPIPLISVSAPQIRKSTVVRGLASLAGAPLPPVPSDDVMDDLGVLSPLGSPRRDGYGAARRIRARSAESPIPTGALALPGARAVLPSISAPASVRSTGSAHLPAGKPRSPEWDASGVMAPQA